MRSSIRLGALLVGLAAFSAGIVAGVSAERAQSSQTTVAGTLGTVRIGRNVVADGEPLAAGTYTIRVSGAEVPSVVGETPGGSRWVEFVQAGAVKGRELATVVAPADVKKVAESAPPAPGRSRVELLQGGQYVRVWINHEGTQYLVHLLVAKS